MSRFLTLLKSTARDISGLEAPDRVNYTTFLQCIVSMPVGELSRSTLSS
jgi:hypothetical protein